MAQWQSHIIHQTSTNDKIPSLPNCHKTCSSAPFCCQWQNAKQTTKGHTVFLVADLAILNTKLEESSWHSQCCIIPFKYANIYSIKHIQKNSSTVHMQLHGIPFQEIIQLTSTNTSIHKPENLLSGTATPAIKLGNVGQYVCLSAIHLLYTERSPVRLPAAGLWA